MSTTINLTTSPVSVPLLTGNQLMIVEHTGGNMVYYRSTSNVGPQTNDGVLTLGQTTQFYSGPVWFASDSTAQIIVTYISSPITPESIVAVAAPDTGANAAARVAVAHEAPLNVAWPEYGAKIDNATDDTNAFTLAANTNAATIYVPPGTAILNDFEFTREGVTLMGAGRNATTLKAKAAATQVVGIQGLRYNTIRDLTIDGNAGASKGLYLAATAGATSQSQRLDNVTIQNCSTGLHVANVGVTQADKNTLIGVQLIGNTIGAQLDSTNSQETVFIGLNVSFTANNQVGIKLNASGGSACLGILGGQCQGNGVATGLTGIQIAGSSEGWVWLKDYIDELVAVSIDGSVTWPRLGVILEQAVLQGTVANVYMGPVDGGTAGGVLYARLTGFNDGSGSHAGNGIIKSYATGSSPKVVYEDVNPFFTNPPQLTINSGAQPVITPGEAPRFVGVGSNPGFNGATDFANAGGGYRNLCFYLDRGGVVHVEGQVKTVLGQATDTTIFTLPVGYRPATGSRVNDTGSITSTNGFCRVDVDPSGNVKPEATLAAGATLGFSIAFMPAV